MMTNLFSIFDPISSVFQFSMNWMIILLCMMFFPKMFWLLPSRYNLLWLKLKLFINKEMKIVLGVNISLGTVMLFLSLFIMIMLSNSLGLFPYIFTSTAHMMITFSFAFPLWLSIMLFGWTKKTYKMLAHCVPLGTPSYLMSFMVCIESISNIIRPGTLAIRLMANMVAGHLMLSLLGSSGEVVANIILFFMLWSQFFLVILEAAVALIQSYVFVTLSALYSSEVY